MKWTVWAVLTDLINFSRMYLSCQKIVYLSLFIVSRWNSSLNGCNIRFIFSMWNRYYCVDHFSDRLTKFSLLIFISVSMQWLAKLSLEAVEGYIQNFVELVYRCFVTCLLGTSLCKLFVKFRQLVPHSLPFHVCR